MCLVAWAVRDWKPLRDELEDRGPEAVSAAVHNTRAHLEGRSLPEHMAIRKARVQWEAATPPLALPARKNIRHALQG